MKGVSYSSLHKDLDEVGVGNTKKLTWNDMFQKEQLQRGFILRSDYAILPTLNLKRWYETKGEDCVLCKRKCTFKHALSCITALTQGTYRWRHNKVLEALAAVFDTITKSRKRTKTLKLINLVKPDEVPKRTQDNIGILETATNW